jgi:hypothetical protein
MLIERLIIKNLIRSGVQVSKMLNYLKIRKKSLIKRKRQFRFKMIMHKLEEHIIYDILAQILVVETERLIDHIGYEKSPRQIVQQWGILVNGLTTEPATWKNV